MRIRIPSAVLAAFAAIASHTAASGGDVPSYTAPTAPATSAPETLTARDVISLLFKTAPGEAPDLSKRELANLDLAELDFKQANLSESNLYGADLSRTNLSGANLRGARLDRAKMTSANFTGADLTDARILRPTIFTTLDPVIAEAPRFTGARLVRVRSDGWLDGTDFSGADLTGAVFGGGHAHEQTLFSPTSLISANFTGAILKEAKFPSAHLKYARFVDSDLSGANLRGAHLLGADFTRANLAGADLTGANLDGADLRTARGLDKVIGLKDALNVDQARLAGSR